MPQRETIATVSMVNVMQLHELDFPVNTKKSLRSLIDKNILLTFENGSSSVSQEPGYKNKFCCTIEPATKHEFDSVTRDVSLYAKCEFKGYENKMALYFRESPFHSGVKKLSLPVVGSSFENNFEKVGRSIKNMKLKDAIRNSTVKLYRHSFPEQGCMENLK